MKIRNKEIWNLSKKRKKFCCKSFVECV